MNGVINSFCYLNQLYILTQNSVDDEMDNYK